MTKSTFRGKLDKHSILKTPYQLWSMVEEALFCGAPCFYWIMKKEDCLKILQKNLQLSVRKLYLRRRWTFQHDNNPKHTAKIGLEWLKQKKIKLLEWPSRGPDLNVIENLWIKLKQRLRTRQPANLHDLHEICREEWSNIAPRFCKKLLKGYKKLRLIAVQRAKGHTTKH